MRRTGFFRLVNGTAPVAPGSRLAGLPQTAVRAVVAAAQALDRGRVDEAEHHVIALLALYPTHPEILRLHAGTQRLRGDIDGAVVTLQRAIAARPDDALYLSSLGSALIDGYRYDEADRDAAPSDAPRRIARERLVQPRPRAHARDADRRCSVRVAPRTAAFAGYRHQRLRDDRRHVSRRRSHRRRANRIPRRHRAPAARGHGMVGSGGSEDAAPER